MLKHLFNNEHPVDIARHPLLEEIWLELEKIQSNNNRQQIYDKLQGQLIPKCTSEAFRYHTKGSEDPLFERIPFACNDELETEMESFLRNIYNLEDHYADRVQMQDAIDSVGILLNTTGTKFIGEKLQKCLDYLQEKFVDIGLFVIIPNISNNKPIPFTDFNSFKDDFLKRARRSFRLEEIPKFYFRWTGYIDIINEIKNTAHWISRCFIEKKYFGLNFEMTLSVVYECARNFERIHSEPFTSMITSSARNRSGGVDGAAKTNLKKAFNYNDLRPKVIAYVKEHKKDPLRSIHSAASDLEEMLGFPRLKTIKKIFSKELEPMRTPKKIKVKGKI
jgi:hypothetical protein